MGVDDISGVDARIPVGEKATPGVLKVAIEVLIDSPGSVVSRRDHKINGRADQSLFCTENDKNCERNQNHNQSYDALPVKDRLRSFSFGGIGVIHFLF